MDFNVKRICDIHKQCCEEQGVEYVPLTSQVKCDLIKITPSFLSSEGVNCLYDIEFIKFMDSVKELSLFGDLTHVVCKAILREVKQTVLSDDEFLYCRTYSKKVIA